MTEATITTDLKAHVAANFDACPVAWPNIDFAVTVKPYLIFEQVRMRRENPVLNGKGLITSIGRVIGTVVSEFNTSDRVATNLAQEFADLFPKGVMQGTATRVTIMKPPDIMEGERDKSDWRIRVIVDYNAFTSS